MRNTLRDINVHSLPKIFSRAQNEVLVNLYIEAYRCENDAMQPEWLRIKAKCIRLYFDHLATMSDYYKAKDSPASEVN